MDGYIAIKDKCTEQRLVSLILPPVVCHVKLQNYKFKFGLSMHGNNMPYGTVCLLTGKHAWSTTLFLILTFCSSYSKK